MQLVLEAFLYQSSVVIIKAYQSFDFSKAYFSHSCDSNTLKISNVYPTGDRKNVPWIQFSFSIYIYRNRTKTPKKCPKLPKSGFFGYFELSCRRSVIGVILLEIN
jgi:hypothetical protein